MVLYLEREREREKNDLYLCCSRCIRELGKWILYQKNLISRYNARDNEYRWEYAVARETGLTVSAKTLQLRRSPALSRPWQLRAPRGTLGCGLTAPWSCWLPSVRRRVGVATYTRRSAEISTPITFYRERLLRKKYELLIEGKSNFMYST